MSEIPSVSPPTSVTVRSVREWVATNEDVAAAGQLLVAAAYAMRRHSKAGANRREDSRLARQVELLAQRHAAELIRDGQARGEIVPRYKGRLQGVPSPYTYVPQAILHEAYKTYDGVSQARFNDVVCEVGWGIVANNRTAIAKALGWKPRPYARSRVREIQAMADQGHSAADIAASLGISIQQVRRIALRFGLPDGDQVAKNRLHPNAERIVSTNVSTLEGVAQSLELVDVNDLDPDDIEQWAASMRESLRTINQLLKEMTR